MVRTVIKKKARKEATGLYILIVCILIILATGASSYFAIAENNKLINEELPKKIQEKEDRIKDRQTMESKLLLLSRVVGWREEGLWRSPKGGWSNADKIRDTINYYIEYMKKKYKMEKYEVWPRYEELTGISEKYLPVVKLIPVMEELIQQNKAKEASAWEECRENRRRTLETINKIPEMKSRKNDTIVSRRSVVATMELNLKNILETKENEVKRIAEEIKTMVRNWNALVKKGEEDVTEKTKRYNEVDEQLETLRRKLRFAEEGFEVDAKVILSDWDNGYVYLDIGRQDAIMPGMEFDIFSVQPTGLRLLKGRVKIFKMYDSYSEASIISVADPLTPMAVDDLANCQIYSRSKTKYFTFAGRLIGKYSLDELTKKIQEIGGVVTTDLTHDINYLVVGDGYIQDPFYQKVRPLGVIHLREKELYELLGLEW